VQANHHPIPDALLYTSTRIAMRRLLLVYAVPLQSTSATRGRPDRTSGIMNLSGRKVVDTVARTIRSIEIDVAGAARAANAIEDIRILGTHTPATPASRAPHGTG
jgi:hypothetical protein